MDALNRLKRPEMREPIDLSESGEGAPEYLQRSVGTRLRDAPGATNLIL